MLSGRANRLFAVKSPWAVPYSLCDLDFANGRYFGDLSPTILYCPRATQGTDLLYTSPNGASFRTFAPVEPRITPGLGLLSEDSRTNFLLNSGSPATQTTASLATGTYSLWVNGSGSATPSAGTATITGAAAATQGAPNTFVVTAPGTVTVTVAGSLHQFQCELCESTTGYPTSYIPTAGAIASRAADGIESSTLVRTPSTGLIAVSAKVYPLAPLTNVSDQTIAEVINIVGSQYVRLLRANTTGFATVIEGLPGPISTTVSTGVALAAGVSKTVSTIAYAGHVQANVNNASLTSGVITGGPCAMVYFFIGQDVNTSHYFQGYIQRLVIGGLSQLGVVL